MTTKNYLAIFLIFLLALSCKKERTCSCLATTSITNSNGTPVVYLNGFADSSSNTVVYEKINKKTLREFCKSTERNSISTFSTSTGMVTQTISTKNDCSIK